MHTRKFDIDDDELERIDFLDGHGHLSLTWDPRIPESVERALKDFLDLQAQGYEFFRVISREPSPNFDPSVGALEVVRIAASEVSEIAPRLEPVEPTRGAESHAEESAKPRRGRARKERIVAGRSMAGG